MADIEGGVGADILIGTDLNDTIVGNGGNDGIDGGNGNDQIFGDAGADFVFGGDGNDVIEGGTGNDTIHGGASGLHPIHVEDGHDILFGGAGDDRLYGDGGSGELFGGSGELFGGSGADELLSIIGDYSFYGGAGSDHFLLEGGTVSIEDLNLSEGDHLTFGITGLDSITRDDSAIYIHADGISGTELFATIYADPQDMTEIIDSIEWNII